MNTSYKKIRIDDLRAGMIVLKPRHDRIDEWKVESVDGFSNKKYIVYTTHLGTKYTDITPGWYDVLVKNQETV